LSDNNIEFRIRQAGEDDIPVILKLVKELAKYEKLSHQVSASEALYRRHGFGAKPYFYTLLAEVKNQMGYQPVGFALYFFTFSTFLGKPTLYLEDLFVEPAYRVKGIGKALLKALAEIAIERDCGRMEWAVLDWNTPAINFYRSIGAVPMEDWTVYRMDRTTLQNFIK